MTALMMCVSMVAIIAPNAKAYTVNSKYIGKQGKIGDGVWQLEFKARDITGKSTPKNGWKPGKGGRMYMGIKRAFIYGKDGRIEAQILSQNNKTFRLISPSYTYPLGKNTKVKRIKIKVAVDYKIFEADKNGKPTRELTAARHTRVVTFRR